MKLQITENLFNSKKDAENGRRESWKDYVLTPIYDVKFGSNIIHWEDAFILYEYFDMMHFLSREKFYEIKK